MFFSCSFSFGSCVINCVLCFVSSPLSFDRSEEVKLSRIPLFIRMRQTALGAQPEKRHIDSSRRTTDNNSTSAEDARSDYMRINIAWGNVSINWNTTSSTLHTNTFDVRTNNDTTRYTRNRLTAGIGALNILFSRWKMLQTHVVYTGQHWIPEFVMQMPNAASTITIDTRNWIQFSFPSPPRNKKKRKLFPFLPFILSLCINN